MKTKKTNSEKKSQITNPPPQCGDFQKMAEMMKNCCPEGIGAAECCSMMRRMMGRDKGEEAKEIKETEKPPKGGDKG